MIHLVGPYVLASVLVGLGIYGVIARRNAVLLLIGVELILSGTLILFVTAAVTGGERFSAGSVLPLFVITIAAAEVVVALSVILAVFKHESRLDLDDPADAALPAPDPGPPGDESSEPAPELPAAEPVGAEAAS